MAKRHSDALYIQRGACNPSGIAHSILHACAEIRAEPTYAGTRSLRHDPALRLMVHQLAFLMGFDEVAMFPCRDGQTYHAASDACEREG